MLNRMKIPLSGQHHLGMDDVTNLAKILTQILSESGLVEPTGFAQSSSFGSSKGKGKGKHKSGQGKGKEKGSQHSKGTGKSYGKGKFKQQFANSKSANPRRVSQNSANASPAPVSEAAPSPAAAPTEGEPDEDDYDPFAELPAEPADNDPASAEPPSKKQKGMDSFPQLFERAGDSSPENCASEETQAAGQLSGIFDSSCAKLAKSKTEIP